jgi:hypothetical protein
MVNAHIEMDLNNHVSVISSKLIQLIKAGDEMIIETLMKQFLKKYENYTPDQFMEGILFLFSLGCLAINDYKVILKNV